MLRCAELLDRSAPPRNQRSHLPPPAVDCNDLGICICVVSNQAALPHAVQISNSELTLHTLSMSHQQCTEFPYQQSDMQYLKSSLPQIVSISTCFPGPPGYSIHSTYLSVTQLPFLLFGSSSFESRSRSTGPQYLAAAIPLSLVADVVDDVSH